MFQWSMPEISSSKPLYSVFLGQAQLIDRLRLTFSSFYTMNSPFNPLTTPSLLQHVRDCIKGASRHLYTNMILTAGPVSNASVVIIQYCYIGSQAQGSDYLSAIASWDEERCLFKDMRERSFLEQQDSVANVLKGGAGRKWSVIFELLGFTRVL